MDFTQLSGVFGRVIPESTIREALAQAGVFERRRGGKLPPLVTFWLVLFMGLHRESSIRSALARLVLAVGEPASWKGKVPHSTSIAQARDRLGWEPFRALLRSLRPPETVSDRWLDKQAIAIDGVNFRAANSSENAALLGKASTSKRTANWPLLRAVIAVGVRSHWVWDAAMAPYVKQTASDRLGEPWLAQSMLERLPEDAVLVADRGYSHFAFFQEVEASGLDCVVRAAKSHKGFRPRRFEILEDGSELVSLRRKSTGDTLTLRRVVFRYQAKRTVPKKTKKGKPYEKRRKALPTRVRVTLLTTLLDHERYPAEEIARLYRHRWEAEHAFDEIKTELLGARVPFRSMTLTRVLQEAYALLIVYCQLRETMSSCSRLAGVAQLRVSFARTLDFVRAALIGGLSEEKVLAWLSREAILPPRRKDRFYPREVLAKTPKYRIRRPGKARAA